MDFRKYLDNFPWRNFGTVHEPNSKGLKNEYANILNGNAELSTYEYILDRIKIKEFLFKITPWGLKFYIMLLKEEKSDKSILLQNIKMLFEAANYGCQENIAEKYEPTKGSLAKYEQMKVKLFDDEFDGTMDAEYLKMLKSLERNFIQISIIEYVQHKKRLFEKFVESNDINISESAAQLVSAINNPEQYEFEDSSQVADAINWIKQKDKLFEDLYLPLFIKNGFSKRGWEFYKEIEKDKLAVVVKLNSSGNNLPHSASFWILIGLKFNLYFPEKLKRSNMTLYECEVQFSLIELLYPEETTVNLNEYWYTLGKSYNIGLGHEIGSKKVFTSIVSGASTGTNVDTRERISERHIMQVCQEFDEQNNLTKQYEYTYLDTEDRYDTMCIGSIYKQLTEDINKVFTFLKELNNFDSFVRKNTQDIISDKLKKTIIEQI